jgi:hypothetical protein
MVASFSCRAQASREPWNIILIREKCQLQRIIYSEIAGEVEEIRGGGVPLSKSTVTKSMCFLYIGCA